MTMKPINIIDEFKARIKRVEQERDLYRARLIDEIMDHHKCDRTAATLDADVEVMRYLQTGVRR